MRYGIQKTITISGKVSSGKVYQPTATIVQPNYTLLQMIVMFLRGL